MAFVWKGLRNQKHGSRLDSAMKSFRPLPGLWWRLSRETSWWGANALIGEVGGRKIWHASRVHIRVVRFIWDFLLIPKYTHFFNDGSVIDCFVVLPLLRPWGLRVQGFQVFSSRMLHGRWWGYEQRHTTLFASTAPFLPNLFVWDTVPHSQEEVEDVVEEAEELPEDDPSMMQLQADLEYFEDA